MVTSSRPERASTPLDVAVPEGLQDVASALGNTKSTTSGQGNNLHTVIDVRHIMWANEAPSGGRPHASIQGQGRFVGTEVAYVPHHDVERRVGSRNRGADHCIDLSQHTQHARG